MVIWRVCTIVSLLSLSCYGQSNLQHDVQLARSISPAGEKSVDAGEQRRLIVAQVKRFSDMVTSFRDASIKATTLGRLADVLWKDDETYARQTFQRALEICDGHSELSGIEANRLAVARRRIIAMISARDSGLAKKLIDSPANDRAAATGMDLENARQLMASKPGEAADFIDRSLRDGVDPATVTLLKQLRASNQAAADQLFAATIARLTQMAAVDGNDLLLLGTYVFTAPSLLNTDDPTAVTMVRVGNIGVIDITADRPGISPLTVRAYLQAATAILSRAVDDARQRQLYYADAYLLLPKAQKFAPELVSSIASVLANMQGTVPVELTKESSYANVGATDRKSFEDALTDIEKLPNQTTRDVRYFNLVFTYWTKRDFAKARTAVAKITDSDANAKLTTLIDFAELAASLETGKAVAGRDASAENLPSGIEHAMLWLAIAHVSAAEKDYSHATTAIAAALKTIRGIDDYRRPFLMLNASAQLAGFSPAEANTVMMEAVQLFNNQTSTTATRVDWRERVTIGALTLWFPLNVKGVEVGFRTMLAPLAKNDPDLAIRAMQNLSDEQLKADALLGLAAEFLK